MDRIFIVVLYDVRQINHRIPLKLSNCRKECPINCLVKILSNIFLLIDTYPNLQKNKINQGIMSYFQIIQW